MIKSNFGDVISSGYTFKGQSIVLGAAVENMKVKGALKVSIPLSTLNRHGLVAGATGTGKTKTIQKLTESLSSSGVPTLVMDIKGDFSGISQPGVVSDVVTSRQKEINLPWSPKSFPVEFLSISAEPGIRLRATVTEFGPVLFSKILELNDTQASIVSLIFKYCDDNGLPLLDLKDFRKVVQYLTNEGKEELRAQYGAVSASSTSIILRKIVEIESQGANTFFGEKSFEVDDLLRIDDEGRGYINILRVDDLRNRPKMFSTFMLSLLAEVYNKFPEEGDLEQPKLIMVFDEAHLVFDEASKTLLSEIETIIKLIRSKGVGIIFCTQNPTDIPQAVLAQLGLKIQHALRAFTAKDRQDIKQASENYPISEFYKTQNLITELGIGEALVTVLNEKGAPTPLVHTMIAAPESRMDTITQVELQTCVNSSTLGSKYNQSLDRESAYELLMKKITNPNTGNIGNKQTSKNTESSDVEKALKSPIGKFLGQQAKLIIGQILRKQVRGLLGSLAK